jgi:uncharacterized membrane protein YdjX (TVP38/TMEM64 family)
VVRKIKKKVRLRGKTDRRLYNLINTAAVIMLIAAALLIVWTALIKIDKLREQYMHFQLFLEDVQLFVISLQSKWLIIIAILLLYLIKAYTGIMPMNALIVISGIVFPMPAAVLINIAGLLVLMSIKYNVGAKRGAGSASYILNKFPAIREMFYEDEKKSSRLLVVFRLVPNFPFSMVSRLYGSAGFPFEKFIFLTLLGYVPRLLSYSFLGNKVFDPFSAAFFTPIIILFIISGLSMLVLNVIIYGVNDNANAERN